MLTGGCFCGAVRYEARAEPFHETICHCADCRRVVGAAQVAWFSVPRPAFRFVAGTPTEFRSSAAVLRRFCGTCGTALTYEAESAPDEIDITTASLDEPGQVPPKDHTWVSSRVDWDTISDKVPTFAESRVGCGQSSYPS
ncbi:GFA family protein [Methylobacterium sp. J-048]|uniref:GFA family protein n=1 Tax=Methylobacterium sp. J-048 TaxID=2836635 RepID=UPI001FB99C98|nr:GFA family protein [Methylobacterium sp. J-048]MCJ2055984.1 GFA family protein [Methylobacterium sp. J-048]